jgi:nitrite reductase/ring-hydroxylating ferredoxin subunit
VLYIRKIINIYWHFLPDAGFTGEFFRACFFAFFIMAFVSFDWFFIWNSTPFSYFLLASLSFFACILSACRFWPDPPRKKQPDNNVNNNSNMTPIRTRRVIPPTTTGKIFFRTFRSELKPLMMVRTYFLVLCCLLSVILLSSTGCKKDSSDDSQSQIPVVPVNISLNPNSTEYIRLNPVNGWEYITGGYRGIIVYRKSQDEFNAFERACPYDWSNTSARVEVDGSGIIAACPVCKSKYILLDGTPFEGPSRYPLKQYQATYDGILLYIFN